MSVVKEPLIDYGNVLVSGFNQGLLKYIGQVLDVSGEFPPCLYLWLDGNAVFPVFLD